MFTDIKMWLKQKNVSFLHSLKVIQPVISLGRLVHNCRLVVVVSVDNVFE